VPDAASLWMLGCAFVGLYLIARAIAAPIEDDDDDRNEDTD